MSTPEEKETTICDCNGRPDSCGVCPYCGKLSPLFEAQNRIAELESQNRELIEALLHYKEHGECANPCPVETCEYNCAAKVAREALKKVGK